MITEEQLERCRRGGATIKARVSFSGNEPDDEIRLRLAPGPWTVADLTFEIRELVMGECDWDGREPTGYTWEVVGASDRVEPAEPTQIDLTAEEVVDLLSALTARIYRPIVSEESRPRGVAPLTMEPWIIDGVQETDDKGRPCWNGSHPDYPSGDKWFSCDLGKTGDRVWAETPVRDEERLNLRIADVQVQQRDGTWVWAVDLECV